MLDGSGKPIVPPTAKVPDPSAMARSGSIMPAFRPVGVIETPVAPPGPSPVTMSSSSYPGMAGKMAGRVPPAGGGFWNPAYNVPPPVSAPLSEAPAASAAMQDLRAIGAPFSKAASGLGSFASYLVNNPVVNNPLTRTAARVAGPVGVALGAYNAGSELLDPSSASRQRFAAAGSDATAGNYGGAAKNAYYGVGDTVGTFTGLKPFAQWVNGKINGPAQPPITMDKDGNFSRAPTNAAEYKQMMDMKPKATMSTAADLGIQPSSATAAKSAQPAMSYNDWLMKQPVSKLNATDYANRANLEIEQRRPETTRQNVMMATNYALSHPEMVTSETHHRDGSWSKNYGDRAEQAIQNYGSFSDHLDNAGYRKQMAEANMIKAQNGAKFNSDDKASLVGELQNKLVGALGDQSVPEAQRITNAKLIYPMYQTAVKQGGNEPLDFDTFLEQMFGAKRNPNSNYYTLPK